MALTQPLTSPPAIRAPRRRGRRSRWTVPYSFLLPMIVLFVVFKVYPYAYSAWLSLTSAKNGRSGFVGVDNYSRLFADPLFYTALRNTATILLVQVPIMLVVAIALAVAFNSVLLRARTFWRMAYFVPIVMGLVAYGVLFYSLLNTDGLINGLLVAAGVDPVPWLTDPFWARMSIVLAMTWHYTGQNAVIYLSQMQSISEELYESAQLDGANAWQRFRHVTVPGIRPAIVLTVILSTIGTLQLFDEPFVLTNGGPDNATLTIGMYLYQNAFKYFDFGYASAIGYVLTAIIALLAVVQLIVLRERD